jgi:hypothetical protein
MQDTYLFAVERTAANYSSLGNCQAIGFIDSSVENSTGFEDLVMLQVFSPGDLLLNRPSARFQSSLYRLAWRLYPRALVKKMGRRRGLFLLISRGNLEISKVLEQSVEQSHPVTEFSSRKPCNT